MRNIFLVFASILISSCASDFWDYETDQDRFESKLNSFSGQTEEQVVSRLGIPTNSYQTGNTKILTYFYDYGSTYSTTNNNWARNVCQHQYCPPVPYQERTVQNRWFCEVTYRFNADSMVQWSYRGNSCY